ncbi:MAG TPA: hypothetical protein VNO70_14735 [Blastocatellia bacterium]|nr:hypothetical protein [Blastocatellia bacterium]
MAKMKLASLVLIMNSALCSCGVSAERQGQQPSPATPETGQAQSQPEKKQRAAVDPNKFALIIAGVGGEEVYTKKFTAQAASLYGALTERLGFDEKNVFMLTEAVAGGPEDGTRENVTRATAEEARKAFAAIKQAAKPDSLVLVFLIGHGSFDAQAAKFNLIGPDLTAKDYAGLVGALPTQKVIFVNCASSSGEFVKPLSGKDRIVITATRSGNEQNATIFAEHFIAALTDTAADADKNGRVSVLEAFNFATKVTADWYKQNNRLATEHALIDDNGDGAGHEEAKEGDGVLAKTTYLDSKQVEQAGADAELAKLLAERQKLEEEVEKLKARKEQMKADEYEAELERLLVELARVSQAIKAKQK